MIRHICMFTLKEENKETNIAEFMKQTEQLKMLDMLKSISCCKNAPETPTSNYDVALIFDFDTVEDLNEYQGSKHHLEFGEFVSSVRLQRACIDYVI